MKRICLIMAFIGIFCLRHHPVFAAPPSPPLHLKVAYIEKGKFWLYDATYKALQQALASYDDLSVEYVASYSPGWSSTPDILQQQAEELASRTDVDIIVAAGTVASRAMQATKEKRIPVLGIAIADPLAAGLVKSLDDSGVDNFTCRVIPNRWANMYRVFYDVVHFKRLGLMYPAGEEGRLYAAIDEAREVAAELGFSLVLEEISDESAASCKAGLNGLKEKGADALFMGPLLCYDWSLADVTPIMNQINDALKLPTFARDGSAFVQGGALMGFASWNMKPTGKRLAAMIYAIKQGAKARDVDMKDQLEPLIAVNLETALKIGLDLPLDLLIVADQIYMETTRPNLQ